MLKKILTLTLMLTLVSAVVLANKIEFAYDKKQNLTGEIIYPDNVAIPKNIKKVAKNTGKTPEVLPPIIIYLPEDDTNYGKEPMQSFIDGGYAVAVVKHSPAFPQNVIDSKAAIRYIKMNADKFKIDKNRIAVWGGNTAAFVAVTPYHAEFDDYKTVKAGETARVSAALLVAPCVNDTPTRFHEVINYVDQSSSYAFIVNSTMDKTSPMVKAKMFADKLKDSIGENNVVFVKSETASSEKYVFNESMVKKVLDFFDKKFKIK